MRIASCAISLALVIGTFLSLPVIFVFGPNIVIAALVVMMLIGALANVQKSS